MMVCFFYPRSTFDIDRIGQRSIFGEIDVFQAYKTIASQLWQISTCNIYQRVWWIICIILIYNVLLLYGSCRCITPGRPPGHVRRAASDVGAGRPLATLGARCCCLHCRRKEAKASQINSRFECRTSRNPNRQIFKLLAYEISATPFRGAFIGITALTASVVEAKT